MRAESGAATWVLLSAAPADLAVTRVLPALLFCAGEVPFNHEILREAYALCHCLPVLSTDKFKTDFYDVSMARAREAVDRVRKMGFVASHFLKYSHL